MEPWQMNPLIRYMDQRTCSVSYKAPIMAYDYRLFAVCAGTCRLLIDGQDFTLNKDSCVIFPPAMPYRFLFSEREPATLYDINFNLDFARGARRDLAPDEVPCFERAKMPAPPDPVLFSRPMLIENAHGLIQSTGELLLERERHAPYGDELCAALLKAILLGALRLCRPETNAAPEPVSSVMRYLEEHCRESIEGRELGQLFGYHPFYLNKLFREKTGMTMHRYQIDCRLKRARSMLSATRLSVREIAESLGYASPAYFSEIFRRHEGVTPGDYRRQSDQSQNTRS